MKILLSDFNPQVDREDILKQSGNRVHAISVTTVEFE
jgi:hypothetical protein